MASSKSSDKLEILMRGIQSFSPEKMAKVKDLAVDWINVSTSGEDLICPTLKITFFGDSDPKKDQDETN